MEPYVAAWPADHTDQRTQGPRHRPAWRRRRARSARCRHRRSRSMTRRNAWRQEGLQNRWHGLRFEGRKCSSHPGRSQQKISASPAGRRPSRPRSSHPHGVSGPSGGSAWSRAARRRSAQRQRYRRHWAWRFTRPLVVRRYWRLARLRRHRRAAARHSGLQYRAWGWVGRKNFWHPL